MSFYIRYIINDDKAISLDAIEAGIESIDPKFRFSEWDRECEYAHLYHGNDLYGDLELYRLDQDEIDEAIEELIEETESAVEGDKDSVIDCLHNAKVMIISHVNEQGEDDIIAAIAPLWGWLLDNYTGLLQADGEGYYDWQHQILKMK